MSEQIWEEIVQAYLTTNRSVLVSRQYEVTDGRWIMCPDLLAIDFRNRNVWVVEVTVAPVADKIINKAKQFTEIEPRLRKQLTTLAIISEPSNWTFGLWAFVRKEVTQKLRTKIAEHVTSLEITPLEDVAFPWEYWDRQRAQETS